MLLKPWWLIRKRLLTVGLTITVGVLVSFLAAWQFREFDLKQGQTYFEKEASMYVNLIHDGLQEHLLDTEALSRFLEGLPNLDVWKFNRFVTPALARRPGIRAFEWISRVSQEEHNRSGFYIHERDAKGKIRAVRERPYYYPVYYVEPLAGNEKAVGFDLGSHPGRLEALEKSRDTGEAVATERITLVQETTQSFGFLIFVPVYQAKAQLQTEAEREKALRGFALGVCSIDSMIKTALKNNFPQSLDLYLLDMTAPPSKRLLYKSPGQCEISEADILENKFADKRFWTYKLPFKFAGREWLLEVIASGAYVKDNTSRIYLSIFPLGLVLTTLLCLYFNSLFTQQEKTEKLVQDRTVALERESALVTGLIDSTSDLIFFKDLEGKYIGANQAFAEFVGRPQESIPGLSDYDMFPVEIADFFREHDRIALSAGSPSRNEEWIDYPDGRRILVDTLKAPLMNREGQTIGLLGVARDIMERHVAEEALQAADEALRQAHAQLEERVRQRTQELEKAQQELIDQALEAGRAQIAAVVLHNIGNAITPMRMYVETLHTLIREQGLDYFRQGYLELAEHRHNLEHYVNTDSRGRRVFEFLGTLIEQSYNKRKQPTEVIEKINTTVEYIAQILTLQQDYFAGGQRNKESVDINQLIDDALAMQTGALEKRQITVNKKLESLLPPLLIDKSRLMQVIINLIKNAYEAIDHRHEELPEKNIFISTSKELQMIKVIIIDSGIGIEPEKISTLFEFGLSHKGSTGVGLYYCKKFIEDYGGQIDIVSAGFNQGATVAIILPYQQEKNVSDPSIYS